MVGEKSLVVSKFDAVQRKHKAVTKYFIRVCTLSKTQCLVDTIYKML